MMILVNKRIIRFFTLFLFLIYFLISCHQAGPELEQFVINGETMGTTYLVKITLDKEVSSGFKEVIKSGLEQRLQKVNLKMSTFLENSEISEFNRFDGSEWFSVSEDTARVVNTALKVSRMSAGSFDITISPLVELWGFGKKMSEQAVLTDREIGEALLNTGYKHLLVRNSPPALKKSKPNITCNLSAIAKGFGVDDLASFLENKGLKNYLVEIGGEDRTSGINYKGKCWRIGILIPDTFDKIYKAVSLHNSSIATSGDYRNYFEIDKKRYSHTINPATGRPIIHNLASVSVIHSSCMLADAYATAINVMGPEKGFEFANKNQLAVLMIVREKDGFREKITPEFSSHLNYKDD